MAKSDEDQRAKKFHKNMDKLRKDFPGLISSTNEADDDLEVERDLKTSKKCEESSVQSKNQDELAMVEIQIDCRIEKEVEEQITPSNGNDTFQKEDPQNENEINISHDNEKEDTK